MLVKREKWASIMKIASNAQLKPEHSVVQSKGKLKKKGNQYKDSETIRSQNFYREFERIDIFRNLKWCGESPTVRLLPRMIADNFAASIPKVQTRNHTQRSQTVALFVLNFGVTQVWFSESVSFRQKMSIMVSTVAERVSDFGFCQTLLIAQMDIFPDSQSIPEDERRIFSYKSGTVVPPLHYVKAASINPLCKWFTRVRCLA